MRNIVLFVLAFVFFFFGFSDANASEFCKAQKDATPNTYESAIGDMRACYQDINVIDQPLANLQAEQARLNSRLCVDGTNTTCEFSSIISREFARISDSNNPPNLEFDSGANFKWGLVLGNRVDPITQSSKASLYLCSEYLSGSAGWNTRKTCGNEDLLDEPCDQQCLSNRNAVLDAIPFLVSLRNFSGRSEQLQDIASYIERNAAIRKSYVLGDESIAGMTIWEAYLNGLVFPPVGSDARFPLPQKKQLVALRPGLGVKAYESDGSDIEIAGLVEIVGVKWWNDWDKEGKREGVKGLSLITAYSPSETTNDIGFGILFDNLYRDIDASVIARDGDDGTEISLLFSVDVSKILPSIGLEEGCRIIGCSE